MDSAVELTQPKVSVPPLRAQRNAYQSREARIKFWRIVIVTVFFVVLIGGNLIGGASFIIEKIQDHFKTADPGAKYRTAKISRPMLDGVFCHNLVLDNQTGRSIEDKIVRCDASNLIPSRGQTQFIWGGGK